MYLDALVYNIVAHNQYVFFFVSVILGGCFNSEVIPDLPWTQGLVFWIIYPNWLLAVDTYSLLNASQQSQGKHKGKSVQAEKHA